MDDASSIINATLKSLFVSVTSKSIPVDVV